MEPKQILTGARNIDEAIPLRSAESGPKAAAGRGECSRYGRASIASALAGPPAHHHRRTARAVRIPTAGPDPVDLRTPGTIDGASRERGLHAARMIRSRRRRAPRRSARLRPRVSGSPAATAGHAAASVRDRALTPSSGPVGGKSSSAATTTPDVVRQRLEVAARRELHRRAQYVIGSRNPSPVGACAAR